MRYKPLGQLLMEGGIIGETELKKALAVQKQTGQRLGEILVERSAITQEQLMQALQLQLGLPRAELSEPSVPVELARYVPKALAQRFTCVPVRLEGGRLYVAMADPLDFAAQEALRQRTGKDIAPMLAPKTAVLRAISHLYSDQGAARAMEEMQQEVPCSTQTQQAREANSGPTIRFVDALIDRAFTERASDIHLEPQGDGMLVRMRIDGQLRNVLTVPSQLQDTVTCRLKIMGGMDISQRKRPQDGEAVVQVRQHELDLRIASIPTIYGEKLVVRLLDKTTRPITRQTLGLGPEELEQYDRLLAHSSGVVLIVGPTGAGKSTTMYAMLRELAGEAVNIVSLEDPVEYKIPGVNQCQIHEQTGLTFAGGLRAILRQDPDIIAVGEIRDGETAAIATRAAITGHLVISTLHTNDAILAVDRLKDIGVESYLIAGTLRGVISQRLVRRLCPHCRRSYVPQDYERRLLGLEKEEGTEFFTADGCPECSNTGYFGRTAVFEIFLVNRRLQGLIQSGAAYDTLRQAALESGFVPMRESCARLVRRGVTSLEEAAKVIHSAVAWEEEE